MIPYFLYFYTLRVLYLEFVVTLPISFLTGSFMTRVCFKELSNVFLIPVMLKDYFFGEVSTRMDILRLNLFETAIHLAHSNDH